MGLIHLKHLPHVKVLYLGKLPGITSNWLESMFKDSIDTVTKTLIKTWQKLEEVHLSGMPVTDAILQRLSELPSLQKVTVSGCDRFTVQGFRFLLNAKELKSLSVRGCPAIDLFAIDEFRAVQPEVTLLADEIIDQAIHLLAAEEADRRLSDPTTLRQYVFLSVFLGNGTPIFEKDLQNYKYKNEEVTQFYIDQLSSLGIEIPLNENDPIEKQWMRFDQILQAYINISRTSWAILKELIRVGFFTNQDKEQPPESVEGIVRLLQEDEHGNNPYVKKVKHFHFKELGLTHIPYYLLDKKWPQLTTIEAPGIHLPPQLVNAKGERKEIEEVFPSLERFNNTTMKIKSPPPSKPDQKEERRESIFQKFFGKK